MDAAIGREHPRALPQTVVWFQIRGFGLAPVQKRRLDSSITNYGLALGSKVPPFPCFRLSHRGGVYGDLFQLGPSGSIFLAQKKRAEFIRRVS